MFAHVQVTVFWFANWSDDVIDTVASAGHQLGQGGLMRRRPARVPAPRSGFAGFRFPPEVIMVAVRWYLRYGLSYRDVEELLAERGITVNHLTPRSYTTWHG
jgi:hypothetical protein